MNTQGIAETHFVFAFEGKARGMCCEMFFERAGIE
jgi:hypothetical protein